MSKKRVKYSILFLLTLVYIYLPITELKCEDIKLINQAIDKLKLAQNKLKLGDEFTFEYAEKAYFFADKYKLDSIKAESNLILAEVWKISGDYNRSFEFLNHSLNYFQSQNNIIRIAEVNRNLGENYRAAKKFKLALPFFHKALYLFKQSNNQFGVAKTYNRLAATYFEIIYNTDDILSIIKLYNNNVDTFRIMINKIEIYKNLSDSVEYYNNYAIYLSQKLKNVELEVSSLNIKGAMFRLIKDYNSSDLVLNEAFTKSLNNNLVFEYSPILLNLSMNKMNQNDFESALLLARQSLEYTKKYNLKTIMITNTSTLSDIFKKLGQVDSSNYYLNIFLNLQKEVFNANLTRRLYKDLLNSENAKIQHEIELKNSLIIYQIAFFSLCILVMIIYIFISFKNSQKQNKINEELKIKNEIIIEQNKELENINLTKDKFFSIIAHDLRNPIGINKQIAFLLNEKYDELNDDEVKEFIADLSNSTKMVYDLLESLLTWSRAQQGSINYDPQNYRLEYLFETILVSTHDLLKQKNQKLKLILNENHKGFFDFNMINTVLRNLITNAIKFSYPNSEIILSSKLEENMISICIEDQGVGISESDLNKLFRIDSKVSNVGTAGEASSGLGLIICKEFVEKNGGTIWVESQLGKGSKFIFTIQKEHIK